VKFSRLILAPILVVSILSFGVRPSDRAGAQNANSDPTLTVSATYETADPANPSVAQDLLIQITVDNQNGPTLGGVNLRSQVPAGTHVTASWLVTPGQGAAQVAGDGLLWGPVAVDPGERFGPFAYRIAPDVPANAGSVFVSASIQPSISWIGRNTSINGPALPLNGLWGEEGLRRTVLPTGLTIFTQERPDTPTVALRLAAGAGSRDENDSACGGSHWLEHAHFLGTTSRPDNQAVGRAIQAVGGEFNAQTGWEATNFWDLVPADKFPVAVDLLSDQMLNSTFRPDAFEREKQVIIQEIKGRADSPSTHAFDDMMQLVFKTSPLSRSPAATVCLLTLPISTILEYRAQHYVTGNIAIAASGNLKHDEAVAMIAKAFAGLPVGPANVRPFVPEPRETDMRMMVDGTEGETATVRIAWPVAGINTPDWAAMTILSDILGDTGSRLAQTIRDNAVFASGVGADYVDFSDAGALTLRATTDPAEVQSVSVLLLNEVQKIRDEGVSEADVQAAIKATAGERALDAERNLDQTYRAVSEVSGTLESYDEVLSRLETVKPADVQRVAQTYLDPAAYSLVVFLQ
jgi:predicted Zn-dependent peptidase